MPPSWPPATPTSVRSRGASSASRSTPRAGPPCAWHCRPANSTSDARRRPAISARRRFLLAVMASLYAVYHGPRRSGDHRRAGPPAYPDSGRRPRPSRPRRRDKGLFSTPSLWAAGDDAQAIHERARTERINLRPMEGGRLGVSLDETTTRDDVETLWRVFSGKQESGLSLDDLDGGAGRRHPRRPQAQHPHPHPPGLQQLSLGNRNAALSGAP